MSPQAEKIQRYVGKVDGKSQYAQKRYLMWTHNDPLNIANGRSLIYLFIYSLYITLITASSKKYTNSNRQRNTFIS